MHSLAFHENRVRKDLELIDFPSRRWVPARFHDGKRILDVVIVGAGQCGLAAAFGLVREKINNIVVLDSRPSMREGPWMTYARMSALRTPKDVTGPDTGIPSLTPRAWFEATYGPSAWNALDKISRQDWQRYLHWFGRVTGLPIRNECQLLRITPGPDGVLSLAVSDPRGLDEVLTRKIVLATGLTGNGDWYMPPEIEALPGRLRAHTSDAIEFADLKGKRVGVIGCGASAFDTAAATLVHGATSVDLCGRRSSLPLVNLSDWTQYTGFLNHFADMSDDLKWQFLYFILHHTQPPTQETYDACMGHGAFRLHLACPWQQVIHSGDEIVVKTPKGNMCFDFVIAATGYEVNLVKRPELAAFASEIALWRDRYQPPRDMESEILSSYPYLGPDFQFLEKASGRASFLRHIHNFTFGATASMGLTGSSVTGLKYGAARLVAGITRQLFLDDVSGHFDSLTSYDRPELKTA